MPDKQIRERRRDRRDTSRLGAIHHGPCSRRAMSAASARPAIVFFTSAGRSSTSRRVNDCRHAVNQALGKITTGAGDPPSANRTPQRRRQRYPCRIATHRASEELGLIQSDTDILANGADE